MATDKAAWAAVGEDGSTTTYRALNASDKDVTDIANRVVEDRDYGYVPALTQDHPAIGGAPPSKGKTNSNSAAGAVANKADGSATTIDNDRWQPGANQADRVTISP